MPSGPASPAAETPATAQADHFIPVRKSELLRTLLADASLAGQNPDKLHEFERLIGSILHFEYLSRLDALREAYHPVDPELMTEKPVEAHVFADNYSAFVEKFVALLRGANFIEVSPDEVDRAHSEHAALRVSVHTPLDDFHAVRSFRRGRGVETFELKKWYGLRKSERDIEVYRNVVLLAAIKPASALDEDQLERLKRAKVMPGSVLIKCYRNIASADLNVLLPNVQVTMSLVDKLIMAVPAVVGGVPILLKLVSSLTVLFVVIGFYLGLRGTVHDEEMKSAIAALGALVALGAFLIRQWVRYERQSLKYLKEITDKVFFRSINHNAGFFDYILGAAEEQDYKEALLAYVFLHRAQQPLSTGDLRRQIETWLQGKFSVAVRFEVDDAVAKLRRLGLVEDDADRLAAVPLGLALSRLGAVWHGFFPVGSQPAAPAARLAG